VPLQLTAAAIEHMAGHGGGHIALVGSVAGKTGGTSLSTPPDYSASKGAVHALVKWLSRNAVGRRVLVNAVAPGPVETPMTRGSDLGPTLPLGRMGRAEEFSVADRFPLYAGGKLSVGGDPGCERRCVRRLISVSP
jgi:3-oxoacyl-[acyl-carrier protein] reductase